MDDTKGTLSFRYNWTDTHMNSETVSTCTEPAQIQTLQPASIEKGCEHEPVPNPEAISN